MSQNSNSMEDILTSIRTSVEEETAKVAGGDGAGGDDVLSLSDTDIVAEAGSGPTDDELIDIDAFANSGEAKPASNVAVGADPLGVNAPAPVAPAAAPAAPVAGAPDEAKAAEDEFDRLLAELETPGAPGAAPAAAPAPVAVAPEIAVDEVVEDVAVTPVAATGSAPVPAPAAAPAPLPVSSGGRLELAAIQSVDGLQVAFPAEVLAAALRPLVKDWVAENLPAIVERLVKDEIAKISAE